MHSIWVRINELGYSFGKQKVKTFRYLEFKLLDGDEKCGLVLVKRIRSN